MQGPIARSIALRIAPALPCTTCGGEADVGVATQEARSPERWRVRVLCRTCVGTVASIYDEERGKAPLAANGPGQRWTTSLDFLPGSALPLAIEPALPCSTTGCPGRARACLATQEMRAPEQWWALPLCRACVSFLSFAFHLDPGGITSLYRLPPAGELVLFPWVPQEHEEQEEDGHYGHQSKSDENDRAKTNGVASTAQRRSEK